MALRLKHYNIVTPDKDIYGKFTDSCFYIFHLDLKHIIYAEIIEYALDHEYPYKDIPVEYHDYLEPSYPSGPVCYSFRYYHGGKGHDVIRDMHINSYDSRMEYIRHMIHDITHGVYPYEDDTSFVNYCYKR